MKCDVFYNNRLGRYLVILSRTEEYVIFTEFGQIEIHAPWKEYKNAEVRTMKWFKNCISANVFSGTDRIENVPDEFIAKLVLITDDDTLRRMALI